MTQIEDTAGSTAEVTALGPNVELAITTAEHYIDDAGIVTVSLVLTPRQARALVLQLLTQAEASDEDED